MKPGPHALTRRDAVLTLLAAPLLLLPPLSAAQALPLLKPDEPDAVAQKYVEDASKASGVPVGSNCSNCALYQGTEGSTRGGCTLFAKREVLASAVCAAWAPMM